MYTYTQLLPVDTMAYAGGPNRAARDLHAVLSLPQLASLRMVARPYQGVVVLSEPGGGGTRSIGPLG